MLKDVWPDSSLANHGAAIRSGQLRYKPCFGLERPWLANPKAWTPNDVFNEIVQQYEALLSLQTPIHAVSGSVA